ncbi:GIY-YIG nuclease family protein [Flavobacterium ustbae]|uniref:GIY-YIG nuclease family protein n=1 Tax=Flavobacterium ustbae TaxID=2488790 RepID=UPI000F783A60|nr:GIY-YIG nuclease family protein [Flavobacterium ustbae]
MKEHIKRKIERSIDLVPEEGTEAYEKLQATHEKDMVRNPNLKKIIQDKFKKAVSTLELQNLNGIGLYVDHELRHFLTEFNHRSWSFGHRKMPIMFNIMEAFFDLDKTVNSWKLLEEEDYLISFFDFIDYYTSNDFEYNIDFIKDNFQEDLIYNYNVGADIKEINFKTSSGKEFVIAGISLVRRGSEITFMFVTGEMTDTLKVTKEFVDHSLGKVTPGKENIHPAENRIREAVKLNDDPNLWKALIACRFDLETQKIDARYIAKDEGNSYTIITDDRTGFMRKGKWLTEDHKEIYSKLVRDIEEYNSIFELAKACLYIPHYFNVSEDNIIEEERETKVKALINNPLKNRKYKDIESKYKIRFRSLWLLNSNNKFSFDRVVLRDDKFKVESSGYWMDLKPDEFGTDKNNKQITGRTWVTTTESYFIANSDELIVSKNDQNRFVGENAGYIYIMRNTTMERNIYKIGLTTKLTDERAKQLSKTSVPDHFYIMREWAVKDCKKAEKEIHEILKNYRISSNREFFKLDMRLANDVIDGVVDEINKE